MRVLQGDMLTHTLRSKAIPEILTFIPVIKNKFDLDGAEVEKNNTKMLQNREKADSKVPLRGVKTWVKGMF